MNRTFIIVISAMMLAGCGGGGGGSSSSSVPSGNNATPTPSPTSTPVTTLSGTVSDKISSAALSGFTVTIGGVPLSSCLASQTANTMPCGVPVSPVTTATTGPNGSYTLSVAPGFYMMTIGKDGTYATLHRTVTIVAGTNTVNAALTAMTSAEQTWLADYNNQRVTVASPASFGNMIVDEYATEEAQLWADSVAAGTTTYSDAAYAPFATAYAANTGAMYAAAGVLGVVSASANETLEQQDSSWMGEKATCPNGDWQTCTFSEDTGHYINISNTQDVWVGLGTSATNDVALGGYPTDVMIIQNPGSVGPASHGRVAASVTK